jgi:hypothetical protein
MSDEEQAVDTAVEPTVNDVPDVDMSDATDTDTHVEVVQEPLEDMAPSEPDVDYAAQAAEDRRAREIAEAKAKAYEDIYSQGYGQQQNYQQELAERERVASMTPEERLMYIADQRERQFDAKMAEADRRIHDANDRASYAALKAENPAAAKLEKEVEQFVNEHRAKGQTVDRDVALTWILGQRALNTAKSGRQNQSQQSQENIARSQVPSTSAIGDKTVDNSSRQDSVEARNDRLSQGKRSYR